jgi:hypothetical protein
MSCCSSFLPPSTLGSASKTSLPSCQSLTVSPVSAYWTPSSGDCLDAGAVGLAMACLNCFADLLTVTIPIPIILQLRMPPSKKIGNMVLFTMALLVLAAGATRAYYTWKALIGSYDETWYSVPLWFAATVELQLAVV